MFPTNAPALADKLAFETDQRYGALVRLFLEDGLKVGDPESTLGDGFGFFQFGPGLSPLSAAGTPLAEFFNTAANDLRTDRPMSEWDPAGDIVWAVNGFVRWFTKDGVVAQMPWLGNEKVLWLTGVNRQGRGGLADYFDAFRHYCRDYVFGQQQVAFEELVAALRQTLSLRDWIQIRKNKRFRMLDFQFNVRRQLIDGKTEIVQKFLVPWGWSPDEILGSGILWLQDVLSFDKPGGTEKTLALRNLYYEIKDAQRPTLIWIGGAFPKQGKTYPQAAEADWARRVFLMRLAKIKSDIDDEVSGERMSPGTVLLAPGTDRWPNVDPLCSISPVWSTVKRCNYDAVWDPGRGDWYWQLRTSQPLADLPDDPQNQLWDAVLRWQWEAADATTLRKSQLQHPDGLARREVESLIGKGFGMPWAATDLDEYSFPRRWAKLRRQADAYDFVKIVFALSQLGGARYSGSTQGLISDYGEGYGPRPECRGHFFHEHDPQVHGQFFCEGRKLMRNPASGVYEPEALARWLGRLTLMRQTAVLVGPWFAKQFDVVIFKERQDIAGAFEDRKEARLSVVKADIHPIIAWAADTFIARGGRMAKYEGYNEKVLESILRVMAPIMTVEYSRLIDEAGADLWYMVWSYTFQHVAAVGDGSQNRELTLKGRKLWRDYERGAKGLWKVPDCMFPDAGIQAQVASAGLVQSLKNFLGL